MSSGRIAEELIIIFLLVEIAIWLLPYKLAFYLMLAAYVGYRLWLANQKSWPILKENLGLAPKEPFDEKLLLFLLFGIFWRSITLIAETYNPDFLPNFFQKSALIGFSQIFFPYFLWAIIQQIILNGYFGSHLYELTKSRIGASIISGLMFAIAHLPNPVLAPITFIGGTFSAYFFLNPNPKARNIYLLALLHAFLGLTIKYSLPETWHHNMKVGPGYYSYQIQNR